MPESITASAPPTHALHALTWFVWALAAAACVQFAPNPVYVALILAIAWLVVETCAPPGPLRRAFPVLLGVGALFGAIRVVLTVLTTHGIGAPWFTVPEFTLPTILGGFTVGGPIEAAVIMQAASESFAIVVMVGVFGAFNACVSHAQLVRSAPRAFHELGLVVTVAIAFVPSTLAALQSVREADRARTGGQVVRRGRIGRLTLPVLERGLEQAITLSESMDSRGFARSKVTAASHASAWCGLGSLLAITAAFVALVGRSNGIAVAALVVGCVLLVLAIVFAGRGAPPRYRPRPFTLRDWITAGVTLLAPLALVIVSVSGDDSLVWNAYAGEWPTISIVPLVALVALLAPLATAARAADAAPGFAEVAA